MALYFSARQVKLCHVRCAGAKVCAPACTLYYAYMFCLSRLFRLFCSGWFHLACLFIHLIKYHRFGWCLFGVVESVGVPPTVTEVQPFGLVACAFFLRSCFIRFAVPFVLEVHTCRHASSCVWACLYAFKHFLFHALLCSFILYIHIYVFPFHAFCFRCRKMICSPKG